MNKKIAVVIEHFKTAFDNRQDLKVIKWQASKLLEKYYTYKELLNICSDLNDLVNNYSFKAEEDCIIGEKIE